jgi:hypothetical protein
LIVGAGEVAKIAGAFSLAVSKLIGLIADIDNFGITLILFVCISKYKTFI